MSRIVAWTGHRPDIFLDPSAARRVVEGAARDLVTCGGVECFLVGGQRGVDTWAAQAAIAHGVPFALILPLEVAEFSAHWASADRQLLESIATRANAVHVVGGSPTAAYIERNRQLATRADLLVAVWTQLAGGGTAETIAFARSAGVPVRETILPVAQLAQSAEGRGI